MRAYYCLFHTLIMIMERFNEREPGRGWKHKALRDRFESRFCKLNRHFGRRDAEVLNTVLTARVQADYHDVAFDEKRARTVFEGASTLHVKALEVLDG